VVQVDGLAGRGRLNKRLPGWRVARRAVLGLPAVRTSGGEAMTARLKVLAGLLVVPLLLGRVIWGDE
jgi:hypothetical protein